MPIRVAFYGFGNVGRAAMRLSVRRTGLEPVGVIVRSADRPNRVAEVEPAAPGDLNFSEDPDEMLRHSPDVVLHATTSLLKDVQPQLERCLDAGATVISTSEELSCASAQHPDIAASLDARARRAGTALVGAGVNPGFIFDVMVNALLGATWSPEAIRCSRVLDASAFGRAVQRNLGLGYAPGEFEAAVADGLIWGHIGFPETIEMIARSMGVQVDQVEQELDPVYATHSHQHRDWTIPPGLSAGVIQKATAWADGRRWAEFDLQLHIDPASQGWELQDTIEIVDDPPLRMVLRPNCQAVQVTAARLVNTIPWALALPPGLHSPTALPPVTPWGDRLPAMDGLAS